MLNSDRPIERPEDDRLGYAQFAATIAGSIRRMAPPEGLVMALHGLWGSGKTSVVNLVVHELGERYDDGADVVVVRFNPWWFSGQENLTRAFFRELTAALGTKLGSRVKDGLKRVGKRLSGADALLDLALGFVPGASLVAEPIKQVIGLAAENIDLDRTLDDEREELRKALRDQSKRVLVVVDDIDRLLIDEIRQIFCLVKSVADLPNVLYLLVFDRRIAEQAMSKQKHQNNPSFLEKIIQVSFELPLPDRYDIRRMFNEQLSKLTDDIEPADLQHWQTVYKNLFDPLLVTPREVTRLLNSLVVSWAAVGKEVELTDFVAIEALRLSEPELYLAIREHEHELTGLGPRSATRQEEAKDLLDDLVGLVAERRREPLRTALCKLFPLLRSNRSGILVYADRSRRERRICTIEHFPTYFRLSLAPDTLPAALIQDFLTQCDDSNAVHETLGRLLNQRRRTGETKVSALLEELIGHINVVHVDKISRFAQSLLSFADNLLVREDAWRGPGTPDNETRLFNILQSLLLRLEIDQRGSLLLAESRSTSTLSFMASFSRRLAREHGRIDSLQASPPEARILSESDVAELESIVLERIRSEANTEAFLDHPLLAQILWAWRDFGPDGEAKAWVQAKLSDDVAVLAIAEAFTGTSIRTTTGGITEGARVDVSSLIPFVEPGVLLNRLDEIAERAGATPEARIVHDNFAAGLRRE